MELGEGAEQGLERGTVKSKAPGLKQLSVIRKTQQLGWLSGGFLWERVERKTGC